ncbi:MAG: SDR family oxidoreductase [Acidobacteriota bacterium]
MNLRDARVLVTGGSSGIGYGTAKFLLERGAKVAICARDEKALRRVAEELGAVAIQGDVSNEDDVRRIVVETVSVLGSYNVLINNAGFGRFAPLLETTLEDFQSVMATNVAGAMLVARESARVFVEQQYGNIVNIASTAGQRGFAGGTAYVASKFALRGMTECWRTELRKHNIRVMEVNPSEVATEFFERSGRGTREPNPSKLRPLEIAQAIGSLLEMDDRGFVTDVTVWATNPQ